MDLATHIYRTNLKHQGVSASEITQRLAKRHGVTLPILLPTDDVVKTRVKTSKGWLSFQEFFVREHCQLDVIDIEYQGIESARPTQTALDQIANSDVIIIAPSNPIVSIGAILAVPEIQQAIEHSGAYVIAVSPLIGGKTVKGPADKMLESAGKSIDSKGIYKLLLHFSERHGDRRRRPARHNMVERAGVGCVGDADVDENPRGKNRLNVSRS